MKDNLRKEPIRVGGLTLRNRLVMPPMATEHSTGEGKVTDALIRYYEDKAEDRAIGLIITEHSWILPEGRASAGQMSLASDTVIPKLRELTDAIHAYDTPVFAQLNHAGGAARESITGFPPVGPSAAMLPRRKAPSEPPTAMSIEQIREVIEAFAAAAGRAVSAGFDGVEIHSAHGYLLNQFYSPLTNRREDAYGGSLENRIRIHREVIRAVRAAIGPGIPLAVRLGGCDYVAGGSEIRDCVEACRIFAEDGVDLLDLSGGMCCYTRNDTEEPGYFRDMSTAVKQAVSVPVLLTGGVTTGKQMEMLLREGCADLIGVGRTILKDSHCAKNIMQ